MKKILAVMICIILALSAAACGSQNSKSTSSDSSSSDKSSGTEKILVITAAGSDTEYKMSLNDIEKTGTETCTYSGRNKTNNNERIVKEYTGVDLKKLFAKAGFDNVKTFKVICCDGYTREYELDKLYDLYTFKDNDAKKGTKVGPMLAIVDSDDESSKDDSFDTEDGTPLRIVYGQESYDSDETKDFNMQGWASYVKKIEIEEQ
mgnify:CR=1 FL=1